MREVKTKLGTFLCKHIPSLHALLGCDTTSRLFGIRKGSILKKFKENRSLQQAAIVFDNLNALDGLCYKKYCDKVATSLTQVDPKVLPPTSASAKLSEFFCKQINGKIPNVICFLRSGDGSAKILGCILY